MPIPNVRKALMAGIDLVKQLLDRAPEWPLDALLPEFDAGRMQLWAVQRAGKITTIATTQIDVRPAAKVCTIIHVTGREARDAIDWPVVLSPIEDWARDMGCTVIKVAPPVKNADAVRKWVRRLSSYRLTHARFEKDL